MKLADVITRFIFLIGIGILLLSSLWNCGDPNATEPVTTKNDTTEVVAIYHVLKGTDIRHGPYEEKDFQGRLLEQSNYSHGKLQGEQKLYNKGVLYSIAHYSDGVINGLYTSYHLGTDKPYVIGNYKNGVMEGKWKTYTRQGKLKEIVTFKNNEENGPFAEFYPNGKIKAEGNYINGDNEQGLLLMYTPNGVLYKKMQCENGVCHTIWEKGKNTSDKK